MVNKKIVWLASYPKSGNTWFRAFLTALLNKGHIDINNMTTNKIFSSRELFDSWTDIDSTLLSDKEIKQMQPEVFNYIAANSGESKLFVKVHDAYTFNRLNYPVIPSEGTYCAIYIIRNPLDIVGSLASHNNKSIDQAVNALIDDNYCFAPQVNNLNTSLQIRQFLSNWSYHVNSWISCNAFPVYVIRYEDMFEDAFNTFKYALTSIGWEHYSNSEILNAIKESSFDNLKHQEATNGFAEKTIQQVPAFFRKGKLANWEQELSDKQVKRIIANHYSVMSKYKYLP